MTRIYNRVSEKEKRRELRKNMPWAEIILWSKLRGKGIQGYKFRRQYSIGKYVVDFYCPQIKLAVEIDGESHFIEGADKRDQERQTMIESYGVSFLRFTNRDIYERLEGVVERIIQRMTEAPDLPRPPLIPLC